MLSTRIFTTEDNSYEVLYIKSATIINPRSFRYLRSATGGPQFTVLADILSISAAIIWLSMRCLSISSAFRNRELPATQDTL
ncbi:hypothetical protein NEOLEDRAFT_1141885 [Neolentinus lepideus HHB14362 ss-1]|uniref:Uncharacterized protein n=1 Tax=Neolentinus lepideus HHB14362 ss-1 TaxID=1314782 RepID=A0A165NF13_9AGAM|nr:hypothetical protein NEOLEDRAFT_1141885 [Neolentinus lepideus HHB14362 ss-1]